MKIYILREEKKEEFQIPNKEQTLLMALIYIKENRDSTLTFNAGCKASVCGTCGVRVNEKEVLACEYKIKENDTIEPLNYHKVLRDLKVDKKRANQTLKESKSWLKNFKETEINEEDEAKTEIQTDCILCNLCYSSCPVYAVNKEFLGPFTLTRFYRYTIDKRETTNKIELLENIQKNGIWDCTLCNNCTTVCPKGIDSKRDIEILREIAVQNGYNNPNFQNFEFNLF